MTGRRLFAVTVAAVVLAAPRLGAGQTGKKVARLGVLLFSSPNADPSLPAFLKGLTDLGYVEGRNLTTVYRYADGKP
jgi:putative ABC transport system substrate-binding protein